MKKKSKVQSGNIAEIWVKHYLEKEGYTVHRAQKSFFRFPNGKIIAHSNDIFNICDIIAKKKDAPTRWIQVSTKSRRSEKEKKLLSKGDFWNKCDSVELWLKYPEGEWKIYSLINNELIETGKIDRGKFFVLKNKGDNYG